MPADSCPRCCKACKPEVSQLLRFGMSEDRNHSALVVKFIGNQHLLQLAFSVSALQTLPRIAQLVPAATNSGSVRRVDSQARIHSSTQIRNRPGDNDLPIQ